MGVLFKPTDSIISLEEDDFNELKNRVYSYFGWPNVAIELENDAFSYIIKRAIRQLNTYSPKKDSIFKTVFPTQHLYTITEYAEIHAVLDIVVDVNYLILMGLPIQTLMSGILSYGTSKDPYPIINYISIFQSYELAKRIFGTTPKAELIRPNQISVNPKPFTESKFRFDITVDHDPNLQSLDDFEINWLIKYCQACVGMTIGQIRRKYDGVQLPVGGLSSSGNSIYSESVILEKELLEELKKRRKFAQSYITIG